MKEACTMHCPEECGCLSKKSFGACVMDKAWFLGIPVPAAGALVLDLVKWVVGAVGVARYVQPKVIAALKENDGTNINGSEAVVRDRNFCGKTLKKLGEDGLIPPGVQIVLIHRYHGNRAEDWFP